MSDKPGKRRQSKSKSGLIPRLVIEPEEKAAPPRPTTIPELADDEATTGAMPVISETDDAPAERDEDAAAGSI